jgi:protein O-mannosyl-transferase
MPTSGPKPISPAAKVWVCLALAVTVLAVYWPVRQHEFINYDDGPYVAENQHVSPGLTWKGIGWAFGQIHGERTYWHPLTWISHMLDCQVFGLKPAGHHLMNVWLHALNTVLLFLVFLRLTAKLWRCAVLAGLFALHPLQVDTVAWVAERKNLLAALFGLLAIWAYVGYATRGQKSEVRSQKLQYSRVTSDLRPLTSTYYWLSLVLFALGLMCKPVLVTLPFMLLLLDYWPLNRIAERGMRSAEFAGPSGLRGASAAARASAARKSQIANRIIEKLPFLALAAASSVITILAHRGLGMLDAGSLPPLGIRLQNAFVSYARYLGKALWPSKLAVFYPLPAAWPPGTVALAVVLVVAVTMLALAGARIRPYLFVGWLWFVGALVPCIGLIQAGAQAMADRFAYLPLVGLFLGLVWAVAEGSSRWPHRAKVLSFASMALLLLCASLSRAQLAHWQTSETLFRHAVAVTDSNFLAHGKLGEALAAGGKSHEAEAEFGQAVKLNDTYFPVVGSLAAQLRAKGNPAAALSLFNEAVRLHPQDATAHYNLAIALADQQKIGDAVAQYEEALRLDPKLAPAHNNLSSLLLGQGNAAEALSHALEALRLQPNFPQAHFNAGNALFLQGKFADAAAHYAAAAQLDPANADARLNRAKALINLDQPQEAEADLKEAARLQPTNAEPHQILATVYSTSKRTAEAAKEYAAAVKLDENWIEGLNALAWILATHTNSALRDGAQAVHLATRACSLTGSTNTAFLETLAAAYAEAGMFAEAASYQQMASEIETAQGRTGEAAYARQRLDLYRSQKPFREP